MFSKKTAAGGSKDWAQQAADLIEDVIDGIRDRAVVPLTTVARGIVYGILIAIVGLASAILIAIATVRLLNVYLGNIWHLESDVWLADLIAGAIFVVGGLLFWAKRYPKEQ